MDRALEAAKTSVSALSSLLTALGASAARWQWGMRRAKARRAARPRVGPFVLLDKLGAGAMGEVYRARHARTGQVCALKLLGRRADERQRDQFEREARFGARLCHPNKVSVQGHGAAADGTPYIVMELVEGMSLEDLVAREGALAPRRVVGILLQLAAVLGEVHDLAVVHRDIKPSNILVCRDRDGADHVKLLDFGLIKELAEPSPSASHDQVVGTPLYISPEALTAPEAVDERTDIYGLGAVAYHLLSGAALFAGGNVVEVCAHHLLTPPPALPGVASGALSAQLGQLVLDCLAKDPAARPPSARELARRLRRCPEAAGRERMDRGRMDAGSAPSSRPPRPGNCLGVHA